MSELIDRADVVYEDIKGVPYKARVAIRELADALESAEAKLAAAREIHKPIDAALYSARQAHKVQVCTGCGQDDGEWERWPCPTVRALGLPVGGENDGEC